MPFEGNPFALLGLSTAASTRDIRRRLDALSVQIDLGLAPNGVTEELLLQASQILENPADRLTYEILWFLSPPDIVPETVNVSDMSQVAELEIRLHQELTKSVQSKKAIAHHDIAVLRWAEFLANPHRPDQVATALANWAQVCASEEFWSAVVERVEGRQDALLTRSTVERLRSDIAGVVLSLAAQAAKRAMVSDSKLKTIVEAMRRSSLPPEEVESAVQVTIGPIRAELVSAVQVVREQVAGLSAVENSPPHIRRSTVGHAFTTVMNLALPALKRANEVDPLGTDPSRSDPLAQQMSRLAFATINFIEDWPSAITMISLALQIARSPALNAELEKDHARLRRNYHVSQVNLAFDRLDWIGLAAHSELAAVYTDEQEGTDLRAGAAAARSRAGYSAANQVEQRKRQIESDLRHGRIGGAFASALPARSSRDPVHGSASSVSPTRVSAGQSHRVRWLVGSALGCVTVFLLFVAFSGDDDHISGQEPTRSTFTSEANQPTSTPACRDRITTLDGELSSAQPTVDFLEARIETLGAQIDGLAADIDLIESQYPRGNMPYHVEVRYGSLIEQHNEKVESYNAVRATGIAKVASYNEKVEEYNDLLRQC